MTTFEFTSPEGKTYSINGPDGATKEQAFAILQQHLGGANTQPTTGTTGTVNAFLGGALDLPIVGPAIQGGAQRLAAGARSLMSGNSYADELKAVQDYAAKAANEHPIANVGGQITGGIGALGGLGATATGARLLGLTGTLPQMMLGGAASGAGIGATDAVVRGQDPLAAGAVQGAVGAVAPGIGRLAGTIAQPVMNAIRGIRDPAAEASRRVAGAVQRDVTAGTAGLTPQEFTGLRNAGQPVNLMDIGGETTRGLARSAANTSPEGRAVLNQAIDQRFETQGDRVTNWLRSTFHYPNAQAQQEAIDNLARTVNRDRYQLANAASDNRHPNGLWSDELQRLATSPDVVDAMRGAATRGAGRAVAEGAGGFQPGVTFENGLMNFRRGPNGVPSYPDLRFWDYTYRNIRDAADKAFRQGANSEGNSLRTQANMLRGELDRLVPEFGEARAGAAHFFGAGDALEAGQNFVTSTMDNRQVRSALARMSPQERQLFQDGFVDRFVQQINEMPDRRSVLNRIAQSPAASERLNIALGPQRANELEAALRVEGIMDLARPALQGNSTTARQLAELGLAGGVYGIESGGNIMNPDPTALMHAALVYGVARGKGVIDNRVAQQVARLLTSNDPGRLAQGMRLLSHNNQYLAAIRNTDAALAAVATRGTTPALMH